MLYAVTSDLHYDLKHLWKESPSAFMERLNFKAPPFLIIAGDLVSFAEENLESAFQFLKGFNGNILFTPGNHDLWTKKGNSFDVYTKFIPELCEKYGIHYLDDKPFIFSKTAIVGNIGWYDYTFRNPDLGYRISRYRRKIFPDGSEWMDRRYIKWDFKDEDFTFFCIDKLKNQLEEVAPEVEEIVIIMHHIPFKELVYKKNDKMWIFGNAYMGSKRIGEEILKHKKVKRLYCGHAHQDVVAEINGIYCRCIGSNYRKKVVEFFEIR